MGRSIRLALWDFAAELAEVLGREVDLAEKLRKMVAFPQYRD